MIIEKNINPLAVNMDNTIREALARMNATPHLVQIVVDEAFRVQGTMTDGDVRRALISGSDLDSPVSDCMHQNPITAESIEAAIAILPDLGGGHPCIPILDGNGKFVLLVCETAETKGLRTALVMAGGFGKRLGERTRSKPKPLIEVGGRPIIWHIINNLQVHGAKHIFVSVHYLAEQVCEFVESAGFNVNINVLHEHTPLGTAGALSMLPPEVDGPLLVMNGDIVTRANYAAMMLHHQLGQRDATIGATRYNQEVPFGVLNVDEKGKVVEIREKPRFEHFVSAGIYIVEPSIYRSVAPATPIDMPILLRQSIARDLHVGLFPIHEYWLDLGHPKDLELAQTETSLWLSD